MPMKVIIIGGGIIGSSIAMQLTQRGCDVIIIDEHQPTGLASSRTFACLNYFSSIEEPYFSFRREGIRYSETLAQSIGAAAAYHRSGTLRWGDSAASQRRIERVASHLLNSGVHLQYWTPGDVHRRLEPHLSLDGIAGPVIRLPDEGWIDSVPFIGRLRDVAEATGQLSIITAKVTSIQPRARNVRVIAGAAGLEADVVCLAAGHGTSLLTRNLGFRIDVRREPGVLFSVETPSVILHHIAYAGDLHIRADGAGRLMAGQTSPLAENAADTVRLTSQFAERLAAIIPSKHAAIRAHPADRPVPFDGYPVAGWLPNTDRIYVATTHSGMTVGPLLGRLCALEILGEDAAIPSVFRASRVRLSETIAAPVQ